MAFDLLDLDSFTLAEEGVPMPVIDPRTRVAHKDDDGTPITITLCGRHSEVFRDTLRRVTERRNLLRNRGEQEDAESREREDTDILIACTKGWSFKTLGKKAFPYNPANSRKLWTDPRFRTLREVSLAFVMNDVNFLPPSGYGSDASLDTSSSSTDGSRKAALSAIPSAATA